MSMTNSATDLRLSLVTLGVEDVERAARFYEALGMKRRMRKFEGVAFFDAGGVVFGLFGRADLAKDASVDDSKPGFSGITLAFNVKDEPVVDAVIATAARMGGKILKGTQRAFWGGYHGYFSDPDGHIWEVAHNPGFSFDVRGQLVLPE
jgi:catechol 2,3-dioxygenase-like lactoylglutathione lyase family enzyme